MQANAEHVIDILSNKVGELSKENAMLLSLVKQYEDKEKESDGDIVESK